MRTGLIAAFVLVLTLVTATGAAAADLAVYGKLPAIEGVDISPDGKKLAMIRTDGDKRRIVVMDLQTQKYISAVDGGISKVRSIDWADNTRLLITTSQTGLLKDTTAARGEFYIAVLLDVTTNAQKQLLKDTRDSALSIVIGRPIMRTVDGRPTAFIKTLTFPGNLGVVTLFRVDLTTGLSRLVEVGNPDTRGFLIGPNGELVAAQEMNFARETSALKLRDGKVWRTVPLPKDTEDVSLEGYNADGTAILVRYWPKDKEGVLAEVSLTSTDWRKVEGDDSESDSLYDSYTSRLLGWTRLKGDNATTTYVDPANQKNWNAILKAFAGQWVSPVSFSANRHQIVVSADSPTEGPTYVLVDIDAGKTVVIGNAYVGLGPQDIATVRPLSYKAADGREITGYLTLPKGRAEQNLPLIVLPHGGPAVRDEPGFDWWSQALASRGYAVLQVNYRGSDGFGKEFLEAGYGEWGKKMQTDLSDGVRYLAKDGIIDPKRVCIVGASYGGYAALAGAALDTGVYRCAVSVAGPADLRRMLVTERKDSGVSAQRYWSKFMGVDGAGDSNLTAISPAFHADAVTIPLMLIHGKDDTVVLYEQSELMARAMRKADKPVEFVTLDGEDHWLSGSATRLKMLEALTTFVEKNNPPG